MDKAVLIDDLKHLVLNPAYDTYDYQKKILDLLLKVEKSMPDKPHITTQNLPRIPMMKLVREFMHGDDERGNLRLPQYLNTDEHGRTVAYVPLRDVKVLVDKLTALIVTTHNHGDYTSTE